MTSPQLDLLPACGDDRFSLSCAPEFAPSGVLEFGQNVGTEVGHGLALEQRPQRLHRLLIGGVVWRQRHLHRAPDAVQMLPNGEAVVMFLVILNGCVQLPGDAARPHTQMRHAAHRTDLSRGAFGVIGVGDATFKGRRPR